MERYVLNGGEALARAVEKVYQTAGQNDYYLEPLNLCDVDGQPVGCVKDGDGVIFCCRRGEREIELTDAFTDPGFTGFDRRKPDLSNFVILTMYSEKYQDLPIAFGPEKVEKTLAQVLAEAGKTQLHLAESEKYAHVTFFFNGGSQSACPGEDDVCVPSPKGVAFETVPALSLPGIVEKLKDGLDRGYDFIVTNFANGDVIGHTSSDAAKQLAAEAVDRYLGEVLQAAHAHGYTVAVTADHGNIEILHTPDGRPHVAHTSNPVALFVLGGSAERVDGNGRLCDVAPTVLAAMGIEKPEEMTGRPLFAFKQTGKVLLLILDGWGLDAPTDNNPIYTAKTPVWDHLLRNCAYVALEASGSAVGLADGKPGNSEAGHINLGSGRIVLQDDMRLNQAMSDGSFEKNEKFLSAIHACRNKGTALHLFALLTKKSSHGSVDYPLALLGMAEREQFRDVFVHIIFDGRSTPPGSAPALLRELGQAMEKIGVGTIVSGVGRGLALDRDMNWDRIRKAYDSLVSGTGKAYFEYSNALVRDSTS